MHVSVGQSFHGMSSRQWIVISWSVFGEKHHFNCNHVKSNFPAFYHCDFAVCTPEKVEHSDTKNTLTQSLWPIIIESCSFALNESAVDWLIHFAFVRFRLMLNTKLKLRNSVYCTSIFIKYWQFKMCRYLNWMTLGQTM